jgi:hypothetical protein
MGFLALVRLGIDISVAEPPEMVAQEGLDNIANGPLWIVSTTAIWNAPVNCRRSSRTRSLVRHSTTRPDGRSGVGAHCNEGCGICDAP